MVKHLLNGMVAATLVLTACGSSKSNSPKQDAGSDSGSTSNTDTDSGGGAAMTMKCGTKTCTAPDIGGGLIPASSLMGLGPTVCCAGSKEDKCGVSVSFLGADCLEQDQVGEPKKGVCPDLELTGILALAKGFSPDLGKGCCKPTNQCGVNLGLLGVGCMERSEASKLGMNLPTSLPGIDAGSLAIDAGPVPMLESIKCKYGVPTTVTDAGTDTDAATTTGDAATGDGGQ